VTLSTNKNDLELNKFRGTDNSDVKVAVQVESISSGTNLIPPPSASTTTQTVVSNVNVQLLAQNTARKGAIVYNDTGRTVFIKLGSTASTTDYTVRLINNSAYELSFPVYTGVISAISDFGGATSVKVTELT
jgi:hypothetical protein